MTEAGQGEAQQDGEWLDQEWRALQRRMVARIAERSSDLGAEPMTTGSELYTDRTRFAAERALFMRTPLLAGFSGELPEPGSVLLFDAFGPPVFIVRTGDGGLNAFRNICPHRGARLVDDARTRSSFVCPFHAWRFDAQGALLQRPLDEAFACAAAAPALTRVPVAEKHGLIFLRCEPGAQAIDIDAFLGPMLPLIRSFGLAGALPVKTDTLNVEANWKLVVDVSCEGYHVPATHPLTLSPQLVPFLTIHDSFGPHHRFCSPGRALQACVGKPERDWPATRYSAVHYLFPNTILTYSDAIDGSMSLFALNRSFPGAHIGATTVLYSTLRPARAHALPESAFVELHEAVLHINRSEDLPMAQRIWQNLESLPQPMAMSFGRNEMILQRYHADVAAACGMSLA